MIISVVIPTYNRLGQLKNLIGALEKQDYPASDFEVVIISDGSTDGTEEYLRESRSALQLRPVFQPNGGAAAARNTGAQAARSELILFLDDDICPEPDLVRKHVEYQKSMGPTGIVLGPMLTPPDCQLQPWVAWEQAKLEQQYRAIKRGDYEPSARQFYTGNASLKRKFFFEAGCFDAQFRRAEDVEFAYRADDLGAVFTFHQDIEAYHYAERSFDSWLNGAYLYGINDVRFTMEKEVRWLLPMILQESKGRNSLIRAALSIYLDKKHSQDRLFKFLKVFGEQLHSIGLCKLSQAAFSVIFNIRYYQGICDQLGGREKYYEWLAHV